MSYEVGQINGFCQTEIHDSENPTAQRYPVELQVLNDFHGGGFRKGEATMVVAPTGGGKTILALQAAVSLAIDCGLRGVFVTTEQEKHELMPRIYSMRACIPFARIVDGDYRSLNSDEVSRVKVLDVQLKQHLEFIHWKDVVKDTPGGTIQQFLDGQLDIIEQDLSGHRLDFVVLDWIGGGIFFDYRVHGSGKRHALVECANFMARLAERRNLVVVSTVQANITKSSGQKAISVDMVDEAPAASQGQTTVIGVSGLMDDTRAKVQFFHSAKVRKGAQEVRPVRAEFEFQRFADIPAEERQRMKQAEDEAMIAAASGNNSVRGRSADADGVTTGSGRHENEPEETRFIDLFPYLLIPDWLREMQVYEHLSTNLLIVYGALIDHQKSEQRIGVWPGVKRLADLTGLGKRAVGNALKELEDAALISRRSRGMNKSKNVLTLGHPYMEFSEFWVQPEYLGLVEIGRPMRVRGRFKGIRVPLWLARQPTSEIPLRAKLLYGYLMVRVIWKNDDWTTECTTRAQILKALEMNVRTFERAANDLEVAGLLSRTPHGPTGCPVYTLMKSTLWAPASLADLRRPRA